MTLRPTRQAQLARMEEARRQTQRQLDLIERQITRRMTAVIPQLHPRRTAYRRGKAPEPGAFLERYRSNLAAITAERQPEIDALARKLARQDRAIASMHERIAAIPVRDLDRSGDTGRSAAAYTDPTSWREVEHG